MFSDTDPADTLKNKAYYAEYNRGAGHLGSDFIKYYGGNVKMGDTPSMPYMMDGDPANPTKESWGGSFVPIRHSPHRVFQRNTTLADTVSVYTVLEWHFKGPVLTIPADWACFTLAVQAKIGEQQWPGDYLGNGYYTVRYAPQASRDGGLPDAFRDSRLHAAKWPAGGSEWMARQISCR
ncbi:nucleoside hydrolase-like domain-containing protein [Paraflavitalea pollutisoli]|uniref:nucleoside hydrolase-like domain-containing protein n=1 Tax=Paraflavitalea pollutisoli TaxID=3034143 RepID=UPI0023EB6A8B|nr:nucleoside hydrolase-like domain-containing protein [Paraflavitalea sp. H1-2-19X]